MKTFLRRGVPAGILHDGWWLNDAAPRSEQQGGGSSTGKAEGWRMLLLIGLIALGDVLIWGVLPGVSLTVFGAAVVLAALWCAGGQMSGQKQALIVGGAALVLLPLVELVQPLSVMIALVGVSVVLAVLAGLRPHQIVRGVLRLWPFGVRQTFVDAGQMVQPQGDFDVSGIMRRLAMAWLLPLGMGLVFVLLLLEANPIAMGWANDLLRLNVTLPDLDRMFFWLCLLPLGWTALSLTRMRERLGTAPRAKPMGPARQGLINPQSVTRALVVFNAVFALQTGMDVIYLYGGVGLPEGISYAQYAHRGAYPLVVTGLLAGGFALLTHRWVQGSKVLRVLFMLWVAQNVALVVSSIVRLDMYVDRYGLTHLRMAAGIWMGLTAACLALILWQVWQRRDTLWLVLRGGALTAVTLYICAFVSFDAVIAQYNLNNPNKRDYYHMCHLGDAAKPIIARYERQNNVVLCRGTNRQIRAPRDWREWGFRNWRARTSLSALNTEVTP